MRLYSSLP